MSQPAATEFKVEATPSARILPQLVRHLSTTDGFGRLCWLPPLQLPNYFFIAENDWATSVR